MLQLFPTRKQTLPLMPATRASLKQWLQASSADVNDVYLGMYDEEHGAMVTIADPYDDEPGCFTGCWESVPEKQIRKFMNWNGEGRLYHIHKTERYGWVCTSGVPVPPSARRWTPCHRSSTSSPAR